jgi:putative aldouronate transport system substrate-binding protein
MFTLLGCQTDSSEDKATEEKATEKVSEEMATQESADEISEPVTLTYWVPFRTSNAKIMSSFAEADAWIEWQNRTGINLEFIHPTIGQETEGYQLMIVSGDLPDIIEMSNQNKDLYIGGSQQAIEDGVYLRLNDYIDQYAPNFKGLLDSDPDIEKSMKTDSGDIWAFQMIELQAQPSYRGPVIRGDWLETLDMEVPETIDEWHTVLTAFKDDLGAAKPYILDANGINSTGVLVSAFGVINEYYKEGDTVKYGPVEQGFKDYVQTMADWYKEGLIDDQFVSSDGYSGANTINQLTSGESGALPTGFWMLEVYMAASDDPEFSMVAAPYPSVEKGKEPNLRQYNERVRSDSPTVVTATCEYPEEAVRFLDYGYGEEGFLLLNYGLEGKSYTLLDEAPKFPSLSDKTPMFTDYVLNNPDFPTYNDILTIAAKHAGPFVRDELNRSSITTSAVGLTAQNEVWFGDTSGMLPKLMSLTSDEATEFNTTMSDVNTYIDEMVPKFIMGVEPMENYDAFVEEIKNMGIDEMIAIKQASYDRYNER